MAKDLKPVQASSYKVRSVKRNFKRPPTYTAFYFSDELFKVVRTRWLYNRVGALTSGNFYACLYPNGGGMILLELIDAQDEQIAIKHAKITARGLEIGVQVIEVFKCIVAGGHDSIVHWSPMAECIPQGMSFKDDDSMFTTDFIH